MTKKRVGIILAAGKGTRMKSDLAKVLHPVLGKSMLQRVLETLDALGIEKLIVIAGHQEDQVKAHVSRLSFKIPLEVIVQEPQLGTGHALMQVLPVLPLDVHTEVLITCGDMPLISLERYQHLLKTHETQNSLATMVTVSMPDPSGYGRVIFENGRFCRIVEDKDATPEEKQIPWVNAGIYVAQWPAIANTLARLNSNNAQNELYLTDAMALLIEAYGPQAVAVDTWPDPEDVLGINDRCHLSQAGDILSRRTAVQLMQTGVSLINPASMTLAPEIQVGADTTLYPGCYLEGNVVIGSHCEIGPCTTMRDTVRIGDYSKVIYSCLERNVSVGEGSFVGPFAQLRDNAHIGNQVKIGNFVEVKETTFGSRSNAAHLCYLGDARVGEDVNMGAGSIIANYDPIRDQKHPTIIEDGVKVGCNSVLISPLTVHERACVAAGSVVTKDVDPWALAIARGQQETKPHWVKKILEPSGT